MSSARIAHISRRKSYGFTHHYANTIVISRRSWLEVAREVLLELGSAVTSILRLFMVAITPRYTFRRARKLRR